MRLPRFGQRRLDTLTHEDIQRLKADLKELSTKTVNNILTVFNKMLKVAVEWGVLDKLPVTIKLLKAPKPTMSFYDFEEYERLVEAASKLDWRIQAMVLLGGDAGLTWTSGEGNSTSGSRSGRGTSPCPRAGVIDECP